MVSPQFYCFAMIAVDDRPLLWGIGVEWLVMDEVAARAVAAVAVFGESVASLGLVTAIGIHIDAQLLRAMGELALFTVWTHSLLHKISTEGTFRLGRVVCEEAGGDEMGLLMGVWIAVIDFSGGV